VKKVVKNRRFLVIFSTKTRYSSLDSLARSIKVGFKMKYNCYMSRIQELEKFIGSWWGDIRVRTWNLVKNCNFHLLDEGRFLSSKWPILIDYSVKWTLTQFYGNMKGFEHPFYQLSFLRIFDIPCSDPNISPPWPNKFFQNLNSQNITIIFHFEPHFCASN
jgi:hypothetical protein